MRPTLLAFDTATVHLSVAVAAHGKVVVHEGDGGARASATLIPVILALLERAGTSLGALDAIAFGRGPGAFTGLRTACSVAQGLAYGAGKPVLPIDTLLAVAADACPADHASEATVWVAMDARMDEIYAAHYGYDGRGWRTLVAPALLAPETLNRLWTAAPPACVAGSAIGAFGARLNLGAARQLPDARPRAAAMLPLAEAAWLAGGAVDPALALPLYLRDKVAQTTAERDVTRALKLAREAAA